ncbi:restriction endonuclease subunit S [Parathalassolituus penaei]|uniref:Restriction endonuclease subunit S n=1 Tax=Parathalassolituus penaei TaxID=2997323 RepID=A0A9X3ITG6_9GAMM|nr:restriction endonuclease subunit S [Parathalassolituus penaei]MCY0966876.1 restriction endonuclease subunit S [Parathalassolituus penaei]
MKLPETWAQARLTDVCELNPRLLADQRPEDETTVTFVPMSAVDEHRGVIDKAEERTFAEVAKGYSSFREHDVLFAKVTPCMENGKAAIARNLKNGFGFGSTEFHVLRSTEVVLPEYLFSFIRQKAFRTRAASAFVGTGGLQRVPPDFLSRVKIPLPTLPEQQRIVDVLQQAEKLEKLRHEFDELLARVKRQLFIEIIGDPFTNPLGHQKKPLGQLIKVKSGDFLPAKDMASDGVFKVYGGNGVNGLHNHYMFDERKVVIGRVGAYCGAVHHTDPKSWVTDNALYISETFEYLNEYYLVTALQLANLNRYAGQAGQPLISASRIKSVEILVPSKSIQNAYADAVLALEKLVVTKEKAERQFADLLVTLTQDALIGNLTAPWRDKHSEEIAEAAHASDVLLRGRGTKSALTDKANISLTVQSEVTTRPARHWLLNELSELQRQVLTAFTEYCQESGQPLLVEDQEVFARFCDDAMVTERLQAFGQSHGNRIRRTLSQLASLGLIAKITLPKRDLENDELDYLKAFRPLRPEEFTRMADVQILRKALSSGVDQKHYHFEVHLDYETSAHAGAAGMFQVTSVEDEEGQDFTYLVDVGKHYASLDELKEDIASALKVETRQVELETV